MSADPDSMGRMEVRVKELLEEFILSIQEPSVLNGLASIFGDDEFLRLQDLYKNDTHVTATNELIDALIRNKHPKKWELFLKALDKDFSYLKYLIESEDDALRDNGPRNLIKRYLRNLSELINIDTDTGLICELFSESVISNTDKEEIQNETNNRGNTRGVLCLLNRICCHLSPKTWYFKFLTALVSTDQGHVADILEPTFRSNPSEFDPCIGEPQRKRIKLEPMETDSCQRSRDSTATASGESMVPDTPTPSYYLSLIASDGVWQKQVPSVALQQTAAGPQIPLDLRTVTHQQARLEMDTSTMPEHIIKQEPQDPEGSESDSDALGSSDEGSDDKEYSLKSYQLELAEIALQGQNSIVCAETGTGKTWVALHVIDEHLRNRRPNETRKVAFMARTNLLISQQADRLSTQLKKFKTKLLEGDKEENRLMAAFLNDFDILCFTPQVLLNNLEQKTVKLSDYTLLVLDECHHAKGDAPFANLMREYLEEKKQGSCKLPQILGLTASIGVGKSKTTDQAVDHILIMCALLSTTNVSTVERNKEEYQKRIVTPQEYSLPMELRKHDPGRNVLLKVMEDVGEMLEELVVMQYDLIELNQEQPRDKESARYGLWINKLQNEATYKQHNIETMRDIISCTEHLYVYHTALEINRLLQIKSVIKFLAQKHEVTISNPGVLTNMEKDLLQKLKETQTRLSKEARQDGSENANVRMISEQLKQAIDNGGDTPRALVFVETRAACRAISEFLATDLNDKGIRVSPLVGKDERGGDKGMTEADQTDVLEQFREGYYMVLVCTSVATEGIDVPDCNIVINYNYNCNEITRIQMKGRIRKGDGRHVNIGTSEQMDRDRINVFKVNMMFKALNDFKKLKPEEVKRRVLNFEMDELRKRKSMVKCKPIGSNRLGGDCKFLCGKCNAFVCKLSDVRSNGSDRFVVDGSFNTRYKKISHKKPATYDGKTKTGKMFCKECNFAWGVVNGVRDVPIGVLRIRNLKLLNSATGQVEKYEKWDFISYDISEMSNAQIEATMSREQDASQ